MSAKSKKGSVLILMLAVIALILVLGTSLIMVNTSTYKVQVTHDLVSRVNYMAESGIEVALGKVNKTGSFDIVSNNNSNDVINCHVDFNQNEPDSDHYTIVSTASKGDIKVEKRVTRVKEPSSESTFNFLDFTFTAITNTMDSKNIKSQCFSYVKPNKPEDNGTNGTRNFSFTGPVFLQGALLSGDKNFSINVNSTTGTSNGIVTTNLSANSFDSNKITGGIINEPDLKTSRTVKTNFKGDFNGFTLIVKHGDMNLNDYYNDNHNPSKQIIYCDGNLYIDSKGKDEINFTDSIIFCAGFKTSNPAFKNFKVTYPYSLYLDNATKIAIFNEISKYLN